MHTPHATQPPSLLVVGAGAMGGAIVDGALRSAVLPPDALAVVEPDAGRRARLPRTVETFADLAGGGAWLRARGAHAQVLLAVKPQALADVAAGLRPALGDDPRVVISILAGTPGAKVRALLACARVVRAMPNLALRVGRGCTAVCLSDGAAHPDDHFACALFGTGGQKVFRVDEALMDAFTALAGSGPAYVFYLAEAMQRAGVLMGFEHAQALEMVRETIAGAAALLAEGAGQTGAGGPDPATLRAGVTSPGGTTAAAVRVLEDSDAMETWARAILAARDRGRTLADGR
ncbi:MAG: pyrroline-5-carboxylate reductase [Planctomycetota bacterium]|nr:pyrroline-5-carboxylate reductase [Planctomycetota bacterium]